MPVYFTSDTHFGDARRIRVDKRPFASIAEHDAALIARWNEVVGPQDEIYHLGDFTAATEPARVTALLAALNGRKHLIIGNDNGSATIENRLETLASKAAVVLAASSCSVPTAWASSRLLMKLLLRG